MDDFREFTNSSKRQIIDYNRFMASTGTKVFICLDQGVLQIARYLLNTRGLWRSTYVKEYVGTIGYTMPTEEEFKSITEAIAEANIDMASCNDIVEAIQGIGVAITQQTSGGGGCGCIGDGGMDVTDVSGATSEDIPQGEEFPEGFDDREAYDNYRCKVAWYILRNYNHTLRNWAGLFGTVGGLTLAVIAALCLLTVPPVGMMLILAALGTLVGLDIGLLASLSQIADRLEDDEADIVCQIYNAATAEAAAQALRDAAIAAIDDLGLVPAATFYAITDNLISAEQMNCLAAPCSDLVSLPDEECVGCTDALFVISDLGGGGFCFATLESGDLGSVAVMSSCDATAVFGENRDIVAIETATPGTGHTIEVTDVTALAGGVGVSWTSETGYEGAFSFDPATDLIGQTFNNVINWTVYSGLPGHGNDFQVEVTVSE